jgi:hypothetical protein
MIEVNISIKNSQYIKGITTQSQIPQNVSTNNKFLRQYQIATTSLVVNTLALWIGSDLNHLVSATTVIRGSNHALSASTSLFSNLTTFLEKSVRSSAKRSHSMTLDLTIELIALIPWAIVLILGLLTILNLFKVIKSFS